MSRPGPTRPTILIATSYRVTADVPPAGEVLLPADYVTSIVKAGGEPLLVPPIEAPRSDAAWRQLVARGHGLLVVGGPDLDPSAYGQKPHPKTVLTARVRQEADARLVAWADRRRMPTLGVCLGAQTLAVHRGGTLIQHLPDVAAAYQAHVRPEGAPRPRHAVRIDPTSRLAAIVGTRTLNVNTSHHQAVELPGRRLRAVAWFDDQLIEAIEDPRPDRFFLGVQWHPENLHNERRHLALFAALVAEARRWGRGR
ncbi:MAG TPA: gamma-glutamyl-gamma-aminobutyrate hydrolase family protein [Phycisphaerae bacterium]|nr:gamma-glutamyl-gamma-aminobutyrate hydrolase family protein [Phycisphaerae bacterium]